MKTLLKISIATMLVTSMSFGAENTTETIQVDKELASKGKTLFTSCVGCHGANAEKKALGKSQVIAGWDITRTQNALNGYKDGSYGGVMKGVMKGQVVRFNEEQITHLSHYIASIENK